MKHLDLFSGIGGFALAASWVWGAEHEVVSFVEIDDYCQRVLKKHWPDVPIISDIRDVTYETVLAHTGHAESQGWNQTTEGQQHGSWGETRCESASRDTSRETTHTTIDLLTGGFPCQPFSQAGKQGGKEDDRYLWPEMLRVIREIRPTWIIGENVAGIINMELDNVLSDLEGADYEVQPFLVPACGVDAPHRRDRVWIVANANSVRRRGRCEGNEGWNGREIQAERSRPPEELKDVAHANSSTSIKQGRQEERRIAPGRRGEDVADTKREGCIGWGSNGRANGTRLEKNHEARKDTWGATARCSKDDGWLPEPNVGRVANGIPSRVDRLKGLGNAIVPQVVVPIMQSIKEIMT